MAKKKLSPTQAMFMEDEDAQETNTTAPESASEKTSIESDASPSEGLSASPYVELPSNGKLGYPATVEYRDLLVKDEETLATATAETYAKTLNGVIKDVIGKPDWYGKMSVHDRDFLLLWIWANNYDSVKTVEYDCGACGSHETKQIDLTEIESKDISDDVVNPFELKLKNGNKVYVQLTTVDNELEVEDYQRRMGEKNKHTNEFLLLASTIDVGLSIPFENKIKWISENMTAREMGIARSYHKHFAFGVNPTVEVECSSCGEVTNVELPFRAEDILYPTVSTDFTEFL